MCLHRCQLLGGISDSQSWAKQSEIKYQNQKKLRRTQSKSRVLREAAETRGVGGSSVEAPADGAGMLSPRARGPSVPTRFPPISAESKGAAQRRPLEARGDDTHPASDPQVHLPGRCAPENQRQGPSRDPAQTTQCHQVVRLQRQQSLSSAWKVGCSFLCTLCFIFIYFL